MFLNKRKRQFRKLERMHRKEVNDRVYYLHKKAEFLCYIDEAFLEQYNSKESVKLEGFVAKGIGKLEDIFFLYDCDGNKKAEIMIEELYLGNNSVEQLESGDERVAIYPKDQKAAYRAGDLLCKFSDSGL